MPMVTALTRLPTRILYPIRRCRPHGERKEDEKNPRAKPPPTQLAGSGAHARDAPQPVRSVRSNHPPTRRKSDGKQALGEPGGSHLW